LFCLKETEQARKYNRSPDPEGTSGLVFSFFQASISVRWDNVTVTNFCTYIITPQFKNQAKN
jgi:hypothetical protein